METTAAIREEARSDALSIHALSLFYGAFRALDRVSLGVGRGEFLALLGPSGCGKTSLLRCIAGFATPREGGILLNGRNLLGQMPRDRNLGFVFQQYALFPHMTAYENVGFGLECRGVRGAAAGQRIRDALALVGLADLAERRPRQLSGGQQQRVALARAIVFEPDMLLLDEPLAALDKQLRVQMQTELKSLQSRLGITSVFVTHDQEEAMAMAGRIAVMRGGRVVQFGAPEEIYANPANAWVGEFIGAGNLLSGRVTATQGSRICFDSDSGMRFMVEQTSPAPPSPLLFFRPESVSLVASSPTSSFTVVARRFLGTNVELHLESSGQAVRATVPASVARTVAQGAVTGISVAPSDCRLLAAGDGS